MGSAIPADADPSTVFEIVSPEPLYEIIDHRPPLGGPETVIAELPPAGVDSSLFAVVSTPLTGTSAPSAQSLSSLPGFSLLPEYGMSPGGLPLRIRCEQDGAEMALVPAGIFHQGSSDGPAESAPEHAVFVDTFYMDVDEVTIERFTRFMEDQRNAKRLVTPPLNEGAPSQLPATGINWSTAASYAQWAGKELPTEAEWEKAARGEQGFEFPWGPGRPLWGGPRALDDLAPVGSYRTDVSPYGIRDLAGNAREWVADWYAPDAYTQDSSGGSIVRNPTGPRGSVPPNTRVVKGNGPGWVVWHRSSARTSDRLLDLGFRCVLRVNVGGAP